MIDNDKGGFGPSSENHNTLLGCAAAAVAAVVFYGLIVLILGAAGDSGPQPIPAINSDTVKPLQCRKTLIGDTPS